MSSKYLDLSGLSYLWGKIKAFVTLRSVKVNGTALPINDKAVNIETETAYDPATNKIATMSDVESATPNVGHLKTNNTTAQTPSASESFTGDISLHKVSKTGSYNDLNDKPTIPSSGDFVTSLGTSGNNVTWTKGGVTNNLTVPYATVASKLGTSTVGASNIPIYLNAGVPAVTYPGEAFLSWGGKNFAGSYGPIDAAMVAELGACRTMFAKPAGIVIEYSLDNGETWLDYEASDIRKVGLFSVGSPFFIGKSSVSGGNSADNLLRVTLHTSAAGIYTSLNKFVVYVTTNGSSGCYCTIRCRTQQNYENDVDNWVVRADKVPISGWSGYNVINITATTTYGNAKSSQYGEWQFIFGCTSYSGSYSGLNVSRIFGFGGVGWVTPSTMASTGHLYAFDSSKNATFPANVTASKFIKSGGTSSQFLKADGSVDSNTYATTSQLPSLPLSIANGGTGQTTGNGAANALIGALPQWTDDPSDDVYLIRRDTGGSLSFGQVKFSTVWNYIKSKIASVLGIGGSNGVPTAPTAAAGTNTTQIATTAFVNAATIGKVDKVTNAINDNFASLDANGNIKDSGSKLSDFATASQGALADTSLQGVVVNGIPLTPVAGVVTISVPTRTSELNNDSGFVNTATNELTNYYTKTQVYTQSEVDDLVAAVSDFEYVVVSSLPAASASTKGKFYLYNGHRYVTTGNDPYTWTDLGSYDIDLTGYVSEDDLADALENRPIFKLVTEIQMQNMLDNETWEEGVIYYTEEE